MWKTIPKEQKVGLFKTELPKHSFHFFNFEVNSVCLFLKSISDIFNVFRTPQTNNTDSTNRHYWQVTTQDLHFFILLHMNSKMSLAQHDSVKASAISCPGHCKKCRMCLRFTAYSMFSMKCNISILSATLTNDSVQVDRCCNVLRHHKHLNDVFPTTQNDDQWMFDVSTLKSTRLLRTDYIRFDIWNRHLVRYDVHNIHYI